MGERGRLATGLARFLVRRLLRVDDAALADLPRQGPLILVANHINFLDATVLYTHRDGRPFTSFVKSETWENPLLAFLFNRWDSIPLRRGEADVQALRRGLQALSAGRIVVMTPEGTRSGHGRLLPAHPGVVTLALHSGAMILPLVHFGHEDYKASLKRFQRARFNIALGRPFYLDPRGAPVTRDVRQQMVDEVMAQLAALLPPGYRGHYANLAAATERFLRFPAGSTSNLAGLPLTVA